MAQQPIHILLIEDNPHDVEELQRALAKERDSLFRCEYAPKLSAGLKRLAQGGIDLVLFDLFLPDNDGLDGLVKAHEQAPEVPIVVLTAADNEILAIQALQKGAQDYLVKSHVQVYPNLLGRAIRYAIERKRSEEQLHRAHAQTEKLLSSLPSILIGISPSGAVTHWNAVAESTFGLPAAQAIRRPLAECAIPWEAAKILESLDAARHQEQLTRVEEVAFRYPDGREGLLGITIIPIRDEGEEGSGFLLFGADITERKQAEAERLRLQGELVQAQKMETIGRFAGGIAHDFQNILQVIFGFAWLLRSRYQSHPELRGDVEEIIHAAESATGMIRQLLVFSRRQALRPTVLEINQAVRNAERLLQQFVGERIRVDLQLASAPLLVKLDPTALEQLMINLCSNARDSMPQGGVLTIRTGCIRVDAGFREAHASAKEAEYVHLSIQDTGTGMDPEVAAHIFEPFFTTKQEGKGTGLGLAVVYGLVQQHEGFIDVETAAGRGTTFHLYFAHQQSLRASPEIAAAEPLPEPASAPAQSTRYRVLVVDDEASIRQLCVRILRDDYTVTAADSVQAALDALSHSPYDLLLTDIKMPGLDGLALIERAAKVQPSLKVLTMSAFLTSEMEDQLRASPLRCGVIRKPFSAAALQEEVKRSF